MAEILNDRFELIRILGEGGQGRADRSIEPAEIARSAALKPAQDAGGIQFERPAQPQNGFFQPQQGPSATPFSQGQLGQAIASGMQTLIDQQEDRNLVELPEHASQPGPMRSKWEPRDDGFRIVTPGGPRRACQWVQGKQIALIYTRDRLLCGFRCAAGIH